MIERRLGLAAGFLYTIGMLPAIAPSSAPFRSRLLASDYARTLGFRRQIEMVVLPVMPKPQRNGGLPDDMITVAYTTKVETGACVLAFTEESVTDPIIIAHEVCHCVLDYELLNEFGYDWRVPARTVEHMEERARTCSKWLTSAGERERLERLDAWSKGGGVPTWMR